MAQHVFVENIGNRTYKDTFRDDEINIPVGGKIQMQRREALIFLGRMSPTGPDGKPVEKMLRITPVSESVGEKEEKHFVCNLDGRSFSSQAELDAHLRTTANKTVTREQIDKAKRRED